VPKEYFVVADVHSFYDEMILSLTEKGFDIHNPNHIFVSLGDILDRGMKPLQCLTFVNSLPDNRKILIKGNHETLFEDMVKRESPNIYDYSNKTFETAVRIVYSMNLDISDEHITDKQIITEAATNPEIIKYFNSLKNYAEIGKYIFVHGWIPVICKNNNQTDYAQNKKIKFNANWRNSSDEDWEQARWINGIEMANNGFIESDKIICCGHWRTSYGHSIKEGCPEWGPKADFTPFEQPGIIALDGCTAYSGIVNCKKIII
jgi:hypothetical protein